MNFFRSFTAFCKETFTVISIVFFMPCPPLICFAGNTGQQEEKNRTADIRIEVSASPITDTEKVEKDGADSVIIGHEQMEDMSATDLPTALRQVPGVTISRYSPVGAYGGAQGGSVYIRGAGTARPGGEIKVYTDGVPRESGVWSHPLMDIAPIDFAERITIAKNPQPQNYPGTFGAVNIETKRRYKEGREGELDLAYGRFNTFFISGSAGGKVDLFDYYAGLSYKYSENGRSHSEAELRNYYARTGWQLAPEHHLSYIYQHTDNWVRDPGPENRKTPENDQFDTRTDTHIIRLETEHDKLNGYSMAYFENGRIRWHKDHLTDGNIISPPGYSNTDWENYGFRSSYDYRNDDLTLTASLDSWSEGGETRNIRESDNIRVWGYNGRFFTTAPYLGARYDFEIQDSWTLTPSAGCRYYYSSEFDDESAPCTALTLEKDEMIKFFLSHARGVHYPGIYARGVSPTTWKTLNAETMDTTELGSQIKLGEHMLHLAVYRTEVENRIDSTSSGYINTGEMTAHGIEGALHLYPHHDLSFFAGGSYSDSEDHPVSRMPETTASAGATYRITEYIRWSLDARYVSSQYAYSMRTVNPELEKLDDYLLLNTKISLDLNLFCRQDGELYIALENLTDERYEYFPDYPVPGTIWYTGMKLKF
ncbi:MAG: TonB-dependent receptor plug domain-containing protein [Kiritimatiellia bacterium]